jgi:quinol monooxygenase YgiN
MSNHVFVVSEWLAKENHEQRLFGLFKELLAKTLAQESGCIRAHATQQIAHLGAPGKSKYTIVLLQEYVSMEAFDMHCKANYVTEFFATYITNNDTSIVEDWCCRLFCE